MFTSVYEASHSRRSSVSVLTSSIASSTPSSRPSSETSFSDQHCQDADKLAHLECMEIIDRNAKEVITNKADEREKKWWIDGNYKTIDEDR